MSGKYAQRSLSLSRLEMALEILETQYSFAFEEVCSNENVQYHFDKLTRFFEVDGISSSESRFAVLLAFIKHAHEDSYIRPYVEKAFLISLNDEGPEPPLLGIESVALDYLLPVKNFVGEELFEQLSLWEESKHRAREILRSICHDPSL